MRKMRSKLVCGWFGISRLKLAFPEKLVEMLQFAGKAPSTEYTLPFALLAQAYRRKKVLPILANFMCRMTLGGACIVCCFEEQCA